MAYSQVVRSFLGRRFSLLGLHRSIPFPGALPLAATVSEKQQQLTSYTLVLHLTTVNCTRYMWSGTSPSDNGHIDIGTSHFVLCRLKKKY